MTVQRYAIVRGGIVEDVTMWNGDMETWQPPEGTTAHAFPTGPISKGWPWSDGSPADPNPPPPPAPIDDSAEKERARQKRKADDLAKSPNIDDKLEALRIRLELLGG